MKDWQLYGVLTRFFREQDWPGAGVSVQNSEAAGVPATSMQLGCLLIAARCLTGFPLGSQRPIILGTLRRYLVVETYVHCWTTDGCQSNDSVR